MFITNYERVRDGEDGVRIDPNYFIATSLDEASVLRQFDTKTYQTFLPRFANVKYKFVATATPSPNRYDEMVQYAGYLGVMDTNQAIQRFFKRDQTKNNNLTLYPHKQEEFWLWVSTWALFITKPSDLGYSDEGYELPKLTVIEEVVGVDNDSAGYDDDGQKRMFRDAAIGLQAAAKEHLPEYAVEKDWWVSMTLKALFKTSCKEHLEFKGGTSLSKGWHLIDRFSEDIDVALNHRFFVPQLDNNTQLKNLRKKSCKLERDYGA